MNGKQHDRLGKWTGGAVAAFGTGDLTPTGAALEIAGGILGGKIGGALPDRIDPPTHPGHRGIGHGLLPGLALTALGLSWVAAAQRNLRAQAQQHRTPQSNQSGTPGSSDPVGECLCHLASGLAVGVLAGFVSHLVADASTPRSLPAIW